MLVLDDLLLIVILISFFVVMMKLLYRQDEATLRTTEQFRYLRDELREQMAVSAHTAGMDATAGELSADERLELRRLLREELARPAARTDRS